MLNAAGDVVRRRRVEERGDIFDVPAARSELPLTAAVDGDPMLFAVVVAVEESLHAPKAGRLEVDRLRWEREAGDVGDRVDQGIPRDPVAVRVQDWTGPVVRVGVLDPRGREPSATMR